jgi:hypothetical protein
MTNKMMNRKRLTRRQFESLFAGEWESMHGDRYRRNGRFETAVVDGWKIFKRGSNQGFAIRGKTWHDVAESLKLVQQ